MQDLRLALRGLRAAPVASAVIILSLALGIGANTAIFTLIDRLVLRALPVDAPEQLVLLGDSGRTDVGTTAVSWSNPVWEALRPHLTNFAGGFSWSPADFTLTAGGEVRPARGVWASRGFFETLGVDAHLGRTLVSSDDVRGGGAEGPVAVLSYDFWQRQFGGATDALGRTLALNGVPFTIVGVTPPAFSGLNVGRGIDVIVPLGSEGLIAGANSGLDLGGRNFLSIMLRLRPGQTPEAATSLINSLRGQLRAATLPVVPAGMVDGYLRAPITLLPGSTGVSQLRRQFEQPLWILMAVVALVLLIACANVANLLLARAAARRSEFGVRIAIGGSRRRLARLLLTESLVLAGLGAALGLLFAGWTTRVLLGQLSSDLDQVVLDLGADRRMLGFTLITAIATSLVFGTGPAWRATSVEPRDSLSEHGRGTSARPRTANALVVIQVALSLVLVVTALLFTRTFVALATRDTGFTADNTVLATVTTPMARVKPEELLGLYERVRDAIAAVPGVERAALSDITPASGAARTVRIHVAGLDLPDSDRAVVNVVSPGWFAAYGTTLLSGRDFGSQDRGGTARVGIVNQAFARHYFGGLNPIGRSIRDGDGAGAPIEIVGYVRDAVYRSLRDPAPPTLYTAFAQRPIARPFVTVTVRMVTGAPAGLTRRLAAAVAGASPILDLRLRRLDDQVGAALTRERVVAMLAGFFGALALLLAGLGLYGVTAQAVSRRRAEIGIRIALGATSGSIIGLTLRRVGVLVACGLAAGLILTWWATRFVSETLLYEVTPRDPLTLVAGAVILTLITTFAGWLPARRAASIDPATVLRDA
jgi:predicted permease